MQHAKSWKKLVLAQYAQSREEAIDQLKLGENSVFTKTKLQAHEVLIEIRSASVSFIDLLMLTGQYQTILPLPCVPGMEYSGVVVDVGDEVDPSKIAIGDRVMSDFLVTGPRSLGAYQAEGGWQTYALAPQNGVHQIPECMSFDQACNLLLNYETPYYAYINRAKLQPGETVLITGASGAAGMAAVQVAKILGATVIATGRSDEKLAKVQAWGADHVINTSPRGDDLEIPRFRSEIKALNGGRGVDVVFDTVGGSASQESLRSLAFGGRMVIVGWAENTKVAQGAGKRGSENADRLPTNIILMKGIHVMGSPMVIHSGLDPAIRLPRLASIMQWANEGRITPFISHTFPLSEYRQAMHARLNGEIIGGCVLHPD